MKMTKKIFIQNLRNNKVLHIVLLVLLPAIIYVQSVKFDYTNFDDNGIIRDKFEIVGNIKKIDTVFQVDAFFNKTGDFYRPVQNLSFMVDAQLQKLGIKLYETVKVKLLKETDTDNYFNETPEQRQQNLSGVLWMFHVTNLLIHILTCIALYFFLQLLKLKRYTAFLLSILFAVHPLFASGVGWIPSRGDILIGLLGVLLFITFHKYFINRKPLWFTLHALVFLVIIYTKETTILFPALLIYYYFLVLHQPADFKWKTDIKRLLPFFILWGAVCASYLYMRSPVTKNTGATSDVLGIIPFFKNLQVVPTIIGKFFVPLHLSTFPLYENISTILGLLFVLGILYLTVEYTKRKKWAVLMGLIWFALFAIVPTIYRLPNADIFFNYLEHRTYLPMIGIVIIIGFFLEDELSDNISFTQYFNWLYLPAVALFGVIAYGHCADYQNPSTLRDRAADLGNASALAGRVYEYLDKKDTTAALADINQVIKLNPTDAGMFFKRGQIRAKMQQHDAAEQDFSIALELQPNAVDVLMARSVERRFLKKYQGAYRDIGQAALLDSTDPRIYNSLGNLFISTGDYPDAINSFTKTISMQPMFAQTYALQSMFGETYNNRAYAKILSADYKGAIADCHTALSMIPLNYIVYNNMAHAYRELKKPDSALFNVNRSIYLSDSLDKTFPEGYFERGLEKQQSNNLTGACEDWKQATTLGYTDTSGMISKYCKAAYYR